MFAFFHPNGVPYDTSVSQGTKARKFLLLLTLVDVLLFVPHFTGFLYWADHIREILPFPPTAYLGLFGLLHLILAMSAKPTFPITNLAILAFLLWRLLDVSMHRYGDAEQIASFTNRITLTIAFSIFSTTACGASLRLGNLPLISVAVVGILVCTGANIAETAGVFQNSSVLGRASGFITDANDSSIAIVCMLTLVLTLNQKFWFNALLIGIAFVGIFLTYSRSGFLVFTLVVLCFMAMNFREHATKIIISFAGLILLGGSAVTAMSMSSSTRGDANVQNRMGAIFGGDTSKMESTERVKDLNDGVEAALMKPVLGHGTGAGAFFWRPHNQFVSTWIDLGIFGAGLYTAILLVLLYKGITNPRASLLCALPVILFLPFSQTLVDTNCYWLIALMAALRSSKHRLSIRFLRPTHSSLSRPHVIPT